MRAALAVGLALLATGGCGGRSASLAPPAGALVVLGAPAGAGARFLGSDACRGCHPVAYGRWRATGHARDFAGLPAADRGTPACLRCHVTGYGDPLGFGGDGGIAALASVGCEACHGAGADHAGSAHPAFVPTATGGECPPCEVNRICRLCHTGGHSPGFDLGRSLAAVSCRGGGQ